MIFVDSNVLVALVDPRDALRDRAAADMSVLRSKPLLLTWPVLTESLHFLRTAPMRMALDQVIESFGLGLAAPHLSPALQDVLSWLRRYKDHRPDFTDAYLVIATSLDRKLRVWSYDSEFRTIWRRPDGSPVPMAVK